MRVLASSTLIPSRHFHFVSVPEGSIVSLEFPTFRAEVTNAPPFDRSLGWQDELNVQTGKSFSLPGTKPTVACHIRSQQNPETSFRMLFSNRLGRNGTSLIMDECSTLIRAQQRASRKRKLLSSRFCPACTGYESLIVDPGVQQR